MRLLYRDGGDQLRLQIFENETPRYAILSHTWGEEEVLFNHIDGQKCSYQSMTGYKKIEFCMNQAKADGLQYCWVDSCCIDKSSSAELSEAIVSMFRWYQKAEKCYVYLSDVPERHLNESRWFTRGWTLQELLASATADFFDSHGCRIGDKISLLQDIYESTHIPKSALQGVSLDNFSSEEKLSWIARRQTTREEDIAYSLLGIFGVSMPALYGEGRASAELRLHKCIEDNLGSAIRNTKQDYTLPFALPGAPIITSFAGRTNELAQIEQALPLGTSRETIVLYGVGGMGKTQLAIQFAKKRRDDYTVILWSNGRDETSLQQSFADAARRLSRAYPSSTPLKLAAESSSLEDASRAIQHWLDIPANNRWLLIIDNVDDPHIPGLVNGSYDVRQYLPTTFHGHVLITTRSSNLRIGRQLHLRKIQSDQVCYEILEANSQRFKIHKDPNALDLIRRLDGLPIALSTAGAYLKQVPDSIAEYLEHYERSWTELHQTSLSLPEHEGRTLVTTWEMSRQRVERESPHAYRLLKMWAFFSNQDLWYELLAAGKDEAPAWFSAILKSKLDFNKHLGVLCDYGLAEAQQIPAGYGMHICVHDWVCETLNSRFSEEDASLALRCISLSVPLNDKAEYWVTQQRLLGHADAYLRRWGDYEAGAQYTSSHYLGNLYYDQGKLAEAEAMYVRALSGTEKALGQEHPSTLNTVNNLGNLYADQGKLAEAEPMYLRALEGYEKLLKLDHPWTLNTVNNLGSLYMEQGMLTEAEPMYMRALEGYENTLGREHPSTLHTIHDLGRLYAAQGKLANAEAMFIQALEDREKVLGREHTSTLNTVHNLGSLYAGQGKRAEAEVMYTRALEGTKKALGQEHTLTLNTIHDLGNLYADQGKPAEAEPMYMRALEGFEKALGREHTSTLHTVHNLGSLYLNQGKLAKAEIMYIRALKGKEKALGQDHTSTLFTVNDLGNLYAQQGKLAEAKAMYMRALEDTEKALGIEHPHTQRIATKLNRLHSETSSTKMATTSKSVGALEVSTFPVAQTTLDFTNGKIPARKRDLFAKAIKHAITRK